MASSQFSKSSKRTRDGQWSAGASGNPAGRPVGSRNKSTLLLEELLHSQQEALVQKTIDLALEGGPVALRLCLERLYPAPRERRIDLALPEIREISQAPAALSTILSGIGDGNITPGEGVVLAQIVEVQVRVSEAQAAEKSRQELGQQSREMEADLQSMLSLVETDEPEDSDIELDREMEADLKSELSFVETDELADFDIGLDTEMEADLKSKLSLVETDELEDFDLELEPNPPEENR